MNKFERISNHGIERREHVAKVAPSYTDIYPDMPHYAARTQVNPKMAKIARAELGILQVTRQRVPDAFVDWQTDMPGYNPPMLDLPRGATQFRKPGDKPHANDPRTIREFTSLEVPVVLRDESGYPLNPMGRTGLRGRGMLDKWGPTEAADPVITRHNPLTGRLEVLLITRGDNGKLAFPGGKNEEGEPSYATAGREAVEEAGIKNIVLDFAGAELVYSGYIDDDRNTDNAWMESSAYHMHLTPEQAAAVGLEAGDDADAADWFIVDDQLANVMLKSHADILALTLGERPQP